MRIQFKTDFKNGKPVAGGRAFTVADDVAQDYIKRGLAVEVKPDAKPKHDEKPPAEPK